MIDGEIEKARVRRAFFLGCGRNIAVLSGESIIRDGDFNVLT